MTTNCDGRTNAVPNVTVRDARFKLTAVPAAVAEARALAEVTLAGWAFRYLIADAQLIISELVTNTCVATPGADIWVLFTHQHDDVWICVWDSNPVLPQARACELDAESGRGLHIVAAIADGNGSFRVAEPKGKLTWARLTT